MKINEIQKEEAITRMKIMQMDGRVISDFEETGNLHVSCLNFHDEGVAHKKKFYVTTLESCSLEGTDVMKIREWIRLFEKTDKALVYHIYLNGSSVSFLYVSKHQGNWAEERRKIAGECKHLVYARNLLADNVNGFCYSILEPACGGVVRRIE